MKPSPDCKGGDMRTLRLMLGRVDLARDDLTRLAIARPVYDPHAAAAEFQKNFIPFR